MFTYIAFIPFAFAHIYLFLKLRQAFGKGLWQWPVGIWFVCVLTVWLFRHTGSQSSFVSFAMLVGFPWLGFSIMASAWLLLTDILRFAGQLPRFKNMPDAMRWLHPRRSVPLALALALICAGYAIFEAQNIRPCHLTLPTTKLPPGVSRLRVVMITDMHIGRFIGPRMLNRMADMVNAAEPDIFLSLGDLLDRHVPPTDAEAAVLRTIRSRYGNYGVLGNHEFYGSLKNSIKFHRDAGITLLRGQAVTVGGIRLVGVDDLMAGSFSPKTTAALPLLRNRANQGRFVLFLSHRPSVAPKRTGLFDLQLSGHTHGGQIWPASLLVQLFSDSPPPHLSQLRGQNNATSSIFVSNGTGFWGPPMRFMVPPEVVIIDLVKEE